MIVWWRVSSLYTAFANDATVLPAEASTRLAVGWKENKIVELKQMTQQITLYFRICPTTSQGALPPSPQPGESVEISDINPAGKHCAGYVSSIAVACPSSRKEEERSHRTPSS